MRNTMTTLSLLPLFIVHPTSLMLFLGPCLRDSEPITGSTGTSNTLSTNLLETSEVREGYQIRPTGCIRTIVVLFVWV